MARLIHGAFHDYVRSVFAEHSARRRSLRTRRARWLYRLGQRAADQRWEDESGSIR